MDAVAPIPQSADQATLGEEITESQRMLEQAGVRIVLLKHVPGKSTTGLLDKISKLG